MAEEVNYEPATVLEALNNKADRDFNNISSDTKNMVIGWGMPDYDSGISITSYTSSDNQFVAPCDGIIYWGGTLKYACYLNGIKANCFSSSDNAGGNNKTFILNEGNTFYATGYLDNSEINNCFFPFKGVNHNA